MIKTHTVETTEKYNTEGKLIEKITREETTEDDETRFPTTIPPVITTPYISHPIGTTPFTKPEPCCTITNTDNS